MTKHVPEVIKKQSQGKAVDGKSDKESYGKEEDIIEIGDASGPQCVYYYYGIGIEQEADGKISQIVNGYPAAASGILVGDIVTCDDWIRGDEPKMLILHVQRGDQQFDITVMRSKICVKD